MQLERRSLAELLKHSAKVIGFWGMPPALELSNAAHRFPGVPFFDLDVFHDAKATRLVPDAYCHIIRNCVDNALALGPLLVCLVAATGPEKCDAGRFAARLLQGHLDAPIVHTVNADVSLSGRPLLCETRGPLKKRAIRIMESIVEPLTEQERNAAFVGQCAATHGFWGTPPHPIEVLDLFPDTTHIFGWTRAVEMNRSADLELEMHIPQNLPTIFFAQGFCPKALLARSLAEKHRGMYVDVHDTLNAATHAKIEAFLRLSVRQV